MVADIIVLNSTKNVKLFLLETVPNRSDGKSRYEAVFHQPFRCLVKNGCFF